jgi:hypothetical protein
MAAGDRRSSDAASADTAPSCANDACSEVDDADSAELAAPACPATRAASARTRRADAVVRPSHRPASRAAVSPSRARPVYNM